jgi:hypothetical protein
MIRIVQSEIDNQISRLNACDEPTEEKRADMLEAMRDLTFLMRVDIENREKLHTYLTFMECVLDHLTVKFELPRAS